MESLKSFLSQTKEPSQGQGENLDLEKTNNDLEMGQLIVIEAIIYQNVFSSVSRGLVNIRKIIDNPVFVSETINKEDKKHSITDLEKFTRDFEIYSALFKQVEIDFSNINIILDVISKSNYKALNIFSPIEGLLRSCLVRLDIVNIFICQTMGLPSSNIHQKIESMKNMMHSSNIHRKIESMKNMMHSDK
jgi:hypothetical protein